MRRALTVCVLGLVVLSQIQPIHSAAAPRPASTKPKVEVVFCLDTTGSMTGLIDGAKAKIWAICNQIASGRPTPDLKVGLVAYRDKGDAYITQVHQLNDDLDAIHAQLKTFQAQGGGDTPESVNQALDDAVNKIRWSTDRRTLRIIFLVGDAPPHMDYTDDVKYPVTCKKAVEKGIIINTIQCGTDAECTKIWRDIAVKSEGSYAAIPQNGGVVVVNTPYDPMLAALNTELANSALLWGSRSVVTTNTRLQMEAAGLGYGVAAERVAYQAKNSQVAAFCLLDQIKQNRVKLEDVKKEELPKQLQGLTLVRQKEYLKNLDTRRTGLNNQVLELDRVRSTWVARKQAELAKTGTGSFDARVLDILRGQAKKYAIAY